MKILILGVNGFIGNSLAGRILEETGWDVYGMDIRDDKLEKCLGNERFHFVDGDICINREWIQYHVKKCDVIVPLVAIATPMTYVREPLRVFELDFEANLRIVRDCVNYEKRLVFPSTSEVYGMSPDTEFDEDESPLVVGPIQKQRWIYSSSKQLLDRVIWAYGFQKALRFTLFRPFNWIGPKLDDLTVLPEKEGSSRVVTQFISSLIHGFPIQLVDGGSQRRCFTYIDDGIDCLMQILKNEGDRCDGQIFNIGNPKNELTIKDLAHRLRGIFLDHPSSRALPPVPDIIETSSGMFYGNGYQDIDRRVPSIRKAREVLGWEPRTDVDTALKRTLEYYLDTKARID